jgi:ATP-dependent helicase/nuclease subunit B
MKLKFYHGLANAPHNETLMLEATRHLDESPANKVFYLVPNAIKFDKEIEILQELRRAKNLSATFRLQIFSFERLAWYFLQNTNLIKNTNLSANAKTMLFTKVVREQKLGIFAKESRKKGFIDRVVKLYDEFTKGRITTCDIEEFRTSEQNLTDKLADIRTIFAAYENALVTYEQSQLTNVEILINHLENAGIDLTGNLIIIDSFSRFNATEQKLIEVLLKRGASVVVDLITDNKSNLFKYANDTYDNFNKTFSRTFENRKIEASQPPSNLETYWIHNGLAHITNHYDATETQENIEIYEADNITLEINFVAKKIRHLIANGARYKDIKIVMRDVEKYQNIIPPIFKINDIPLDLTKKEKVKSHALTQFITSLFKIKTNYYRAHDVFSLLKTELLIPQNLTTKEFRAQIDKTENVVISYGYEGSDFTRQQDWVYNKREISDDDIYATTESDIERDVSNQIRNFLKDTLEPFYADLNQAETGQEAAKIFYEFLINAGIENQVKNLRDLMLEKNELERSRSFELLWASICDLLDEYTSIFGADPFDFKEFADIITTALDSLEFGQVPINLDCVTITKLDLIRPNQAKYIFALGLTDSEFPQIEQKQRLLNEVELEVFSRTINDKNKEKFLNDNYESTLARDPLIAYLLFKSATEKLTLTYPTSIDGAKSVATSPYIRQISSHINIPINKIKAIHPSDNQTEILDNVSTYRVLINDFVSLHQQIQSDANFANYKVFHHLATRASQNPWAAKIGRSMRYKNEPAKLKTDLYGTDIITSVSKLEQFYGCSYQHFINAGLNLKEREILDLDSRVIGNFLHAALDQFFKTGNTEEALKTVLSQRQFEILKRNKRMNYLSYKLSNVIRRVTQIIKQQDAQTLFKTVDTEAAFGRSIHGAGKLKGLPPFQLDPTHQLSMHGIIDRITLNEKENQAQIIDYKSSARKFDETDAANGLALQLITYLDVVTTNLDYKANSAKYFHMHEEILDFSKLTAKQKADIPQAYLDEYKMKGVDITGPEIFEQNRNLIQRAGEKIITGEIEINPAKKQTCEFCKFKGICKIEGGK